MSIEYPSHERTDEEFAEAFDDLLVTLHDQVEDPHLVGLHAEAAEAAAYLNAHPEEATSILGDFVQRLDSKWEYDGQDMELTGTIWVVKPGTSEVLTRINVVNHTVTSRGFMIARKGVADTLDDTTDMQLAAGHYVKLAPAEQWPEGANGVAFIEDIEHIMLPYPSQAMRSKDLRYYHPDKLEQIDRIIAHAGRPDQALKDIGALSFVVDHSKKGEMDLAADIFRYLVEHLRVDASASYRVKLRGGYFRLDDDGQILPAPEPKPLQAVTVITTAVLIRHPQYFGYREEGLQTYIPCLAMTILEPSETVPDWGIVAPCESIEWISSSRYDQGFGPTYCDIDTEPTS